MKSCYFNSALNELLFFTIVVYSEVGSVVDCSEKYTKKLMSHLHMFKKERRVIQEDTHNVSGWHHHNISYASGST